MKNKKYIRRHKTKIYLVNILLICFPMVSCGILEIASEEKFRQSLHRYIDKPIDDVVRRYGYTDHTSQSPTGNRLFIYSSSRSTRSPVSCKTDASGDTECRGGNTSNKWCKIFFEVNNENIVVNYSYRGNNCKYCTNGNRLYCI